jgi:hypothetical protein
MVLAMRRRRIALLLSGFSVLAAIAGFLATGGGPEDCPTTLEFRGHSYNAVSTGDEVVEGNVVGDGIERGCGDAGRWSQVVQLARVPGVNPRTALATPTADDTLYIAVEASQEDLPARVTDLIDQP